MRTGKVALSAVVISRDDEATIPRTVASVVTQVCPEPVEVIVVTSGYDRTADIVREHFPDVTLIALPRPALPGEARNAGLRVARGTYVSFPGSHVELPAGSLAARLAAHRQGFDMVTGATLNGTLTAAGWAAYFLDHAGNLPHGTPRVLRRAPAHCSYGRAALGRVGGFPEGVRAGEDTAVNAALFRLGYRALRDPRILFVHHNPCRTPVVLLRHYFARGRGEGHVALRATVPGAPRLRRLARFEPISRLGRITSAVLAVTPPYRKTYARVLPLVLLGVWATWLGICHALARPATGTRAVATGRPAVDSGG